MTRDLGRGANLAMMGMMMLDHRSEPWMADAACRQRPELDFFPTRGQSVIPLREVCRGCSVRTDCLHYALTNRERVGIWGGLSGHERRMLGRQRSSGRERESRAMADVVFDDPAATNGVRHCQRPGCDEPVRDPRARYCCRECQSMVNNAKARDRLRMAQEAANGSAAVVTIRPRARHPWPSLRRSWPSWTRERSG